jgi:hypothetical protein
MRMHDQIAAVRTSSHGAEVHCGFIFASFMTLAHFFV